MNCCDWQLLLVDDSEEKDTNTAATFCSSFSSSMTALSPSATTRNEGEDDAFVASDHSRSSITNGKSGDASPQTIVQPRRLSAAIVKDEAHEYTKGRPTLVLSGSGDSDPERLEKPTSRRKMSITGTRNSLRRLSSAPLEDEASKVRTIPPPLRLEAWAEPAADTFKVRGPRYLRDQKKFPSDGSVFQLLTVDCLQTKKPVRSGICSLPNERIQLALKREAETGFGEHLPAFVLCINLIMPGDPLYHLVFYFGCNDIETLKTNKTPFGRVARRFFFGSSDEFRDQTFKIIPRIVDGNFVVKKAVGSKPALLGTKVAQSYICTERFCEIVVDISSDAVAEKIVKLTLGYVSCCRRCIGREYVASFSFIIYMSFYCRQSQLSSTWDLCWKERIKTNCQKCCLAQSG